MYSLYIDTHGTYVTIVLFKDGIVLIKKEIDSDCSHSRNTMPLIKQILDDENINPKDLNEIIVVNGPGSFTGVRIGVTIAKTLAYTLNIPIKVVSSLLIKAISFDSDSSKIVIISDNKGKYIGEFDQNNVELEPYKYLKNKEYESFMINKEIIDNIEIDYDRVYKYLKEVKALNAHKVNPIYVKNIEVK